MRNSPYIKMDDWNSIIDDIGEMLKITCSNSPFRLFFKGIEVHHINYERASFPDRNESLCIWIYAVGEVGNRPTPNYERGFGLRAISILDKMYLDEEQIRKILQDLEVRKVEIVAVMKEKNDNI